MGIVSDAVHIFFDSLSVILGMVSFVIPLEKKILKTQHKIFNLDDLFTLGQCLLLFITSIELIKDSYEHFIQQEEIHTQHLLAISLVSFFINLYTLWVSHGLHELVTGKAHSCSHSHKHLHNDHHEHEHKHHGHHEHEHHDHHEHKHNDNKLFEDEESKKKIKVEHSVNQLENLKSMIIHLAFDLVSSFLVVISCLMIKYYSIQIFDSICSLVISIIILITAVPLFKQVMKNLSQRNQYNLTDLFDCPLLKNEINQLVIRTSSGNILFIDIPEVMQNQIRNKNEFLQKNNLKDVIY